MKLTGQILREAREKQQLSLSEISMATKINQKVLKAMELGDLNQLPARTFLRGFVQVYAAYLKLDVDQVMLKFQEEIEPPHAEAEPGEDLGAQVISGKTLPTSMETSSAFKISAVAGIVLLIGIVFGVKHLIDKYEREREVQPLPEVLETVNPTPTQPETPPTQTPAGAVAGPTETSSPTEKSTTVNPAPTTPAPSAATTPATPAPTTPSPSPSATAGSITLTPPAKPIAQPTPPVTPPSQPATPTPPVETAAKPAPPAETPKPATAGATAETPAPPPAKPAASTTEVILEAFDRIEVVVQADKEGLKKLVLQPDEVHTIKSQGRVVLDLSDGGAVNLIVNGKDRGVPGDLGKPKKVELP